MESSIKLINGFTEQIISALHEPSKASWLVCFLEAAFFCTFPVSSSMCCTGWELRKSTISSMMCIFLLILMALWSLPSSRSQIHCFVINLRLLLRETFQTAIRKLLKRVIMGVAWFTCTDEEHVIHLMCCLDSMDSDLCVASVSFQ